MPRSTVIFHPSGLWLFMPGLGLIIFCGYLLVRNLHPVFFWKKAKGTITGVEHVTIRNSEGSDDNFFETATFIDHHGQQRQAITLSSAGTTDGNIQVSGEVTVYYNPEDPSKSIIFLWRDYVALIFFPFALLLLFLGWPIEKISHGTIP